MSDLTVAAGVASALGTAINTVKNLRETLKSAKDAAVGQAVNAAYQSLIELQESVRELQNENVELRAQLAKKSDLIGPLPPFNYFYKVGDLERERPISPKCLQHEKSIVCYLSDPERWSGGIRRRCNLCDWLNYEEPTKSGSVVARRQPSWRNRL
jgi:hypothetical protein